MTQQQTNQQQSTPNGTQSSSQNLTATYMQRFDDLQNAIVKSRTDISFSVKLLVDSLLGEVKKLFVALPFGDINTALTDIKNSLPSLAKTADLQQLVTKADLAAFAQQVQTALDAQKKPLPAQTLQSSVVANRQAQKTNTTWGCLRSPFRLAGLVIHYCAVGIGYLVLVASILWTLGGLQFDAEFLRLFVNLP